MNRTGTHKFQAEKSFDKMDMNDGTRNVAPSYDSKSMAGRSDCLSEHYIRAKKFAALRTTNKKNNKKK